MAVVYRVFNVVTEQFYIGSAVNFRRRRWEHIDSLKKGTHHCVKLQAAWDEYGQDAFEFEVLEEVPDEEVLRIEDTYLVQHAGHERCYNTALSTMQPSSTAAATREKIRASMKRLYAEPSKHPRFGKAHTEETKAKISAAKKANPVRHWLGKQRDEETRQKISEAQKNVPKPGRVYTEEGLAKVREVMRRNAKENKPSDFAAVKAKFPAEVLSRYDFSEAVYTGALIRIEGCKCPTHGVFSQYAAQFRKGRGCPQCGAEQRAESKRMQMKAAWSTAEGRELFMNSRQQLTPPAQTDKTAPYQASYCLLTDLAD